LAAVVQEEIILLEPLDLPVLVAVVCTLLAVLLMVFNTVEEAV
jgi:hypothetical protein